MKKAIYTFLKLECQKLIHVRFRPGGFPYFGSALKRAVKHGHVDIKRVEDMSRRIIAAWYKVRAVLHFIWLCFPNQRDKLLDATRRGW